MSPSRTARNLSWTLAAATLFMIFAGAMVTTMKAGDSVPDWPLSYGQVLPPMEGLVFFEHGHRMVGWLVGAICIALAVTAGPGIRVLSWALLLLVLFQGGLGGYRVLVVQEMPFEQMESWRAGLSMLHAGTAQVFFALTAWGVWKASTDSPPSPSPLPPGERVVMGYFAALITAVQVLLGIVARQTGNLIWVHALFALAAFAAVSIFASRLASLPQDQPTQKWGAPLAGLILIQAGLGMGSLAYLLTAPESPPGLLEALVRSFHVALGALTLGLTWVLAMGSRRA